MDTVQLLDLHIDRRAQQVRRADVLLPVAGLSWRLLDCLLAHGTEVVSFDTLARDVWAPAVVGEDAISQRVKLLRQALGDDGRRPRYVRSVRGRGYQLCALPEPVTLGHADTLTVRRRRRWMWGAAGAGIVAVAVIAVVVWPQRVALSPASPLLQRADHYAGIGQASNNQRAIVLYRQALQVDPESMMARRGLARALAAEGCLFNGPRQSAEEALTLASDLLRRAPDDAAAFAARGYAHDCLGEMAQATADYRQALQRDPDDDATRASLAYLYQEQGHLAQALQDNLAVRAPGRVRFLEVQVARELELLGFTDAAARRHQRNFQLYPDNVFANIAWPRSLLLSGDQVSAEAALMQALARGTPHPGLLRLQGELKLMQGDPAGAVEAFERSRQLRPQQSLGQTLAGLYGSAPVSSEWVAARLQMLRAQPDDGWADAALERALLHQAQGDTDAAMADLRQAVTMGFRDATWLRTTPLFIRLRAEPGFTRLLATIDADVAAQRARVLAADWRPDDLRGLSATPAAGIR